MFNMHMPGSRRSCAGQKERGIELADFSSPEIPSPAIRQKTRHCCAEIALYERDAGKCGRDLAPHYVSNYLRELAALCIAIMPNIR